MNYERLAELATSSTRNTINLAKLFATSFTTQREIEQGRLGLFEKAIVTRKDAYRSILESVEQKEEAEGSKLDALLGALGLGGLAKGLRGIRAPKSATSIPATPRVLPTPPQTRVTGRGVIPRTPKLPRGRLAGIPGLNVALTGLDFLQRKQAGQTNLQAGAGSLASTLAAIGTAGLVGTAIGGPVGTIAGLAAGTLAAFGTGSLIDMLTGANDVEGRIEQEERRTRIIGKTKFSEALDQFDSVLGNLAKLAEYLKSGGKPTGGTDRDIPMNTEGVNPEDIRNAKPLRPDAGPPSPENRMPDASAPGAYGIPGDPKSPRIGEWVGSMPPNIKPASRGVGGQLLEPKTNEVAFQRGGMQSIPSTNYQVAQSSGGGTNTFTSQSSDNVVILDKQPNTVVVNQPVPVGGGSVVNSGPSSYEVATKYAKMISSLTA